MNCRLLADELRRSQRYQVSAAASPRKVFRLLAGGGFNVIVIGIGSSEHRLERIRFVRQIRGLHPDANIIVLLDSLERALVVEAFRSGARGVFCRADRFEALCKCIRCVHEGQIWAGSVELRFVLEALVNDGRPAASALTSARQLSKREEEITRLVAEGYSNRQISERLQLSEHTIKNYLFRIFEKLGVSTRVALTLYALKHTQDTEQKPAKRPPSFTPAYPDEASGLTSSN